MEIQIYNLINQSTNSPRRQNDLFFDSTKRQIDTLGKPKQLFLQVGRRVVLIYGFSPTLKSFTGSAGRHQVETDDRKTGSIGQPRRSARAKSSKQIYDSAKSSWRKLVLGPLPKQFSSGLGHVTARSDFIIINHY